MASDTGATPNTFVERDTNGDITAVNQVATGSHKSSGGAYRGIVAKTATVTVDDTMDTILCDAAAGSFAVNLPAAATCTRKRITVKKTTAANTVTITANGAEVIDAASTLALTVQYSSRTIQSDGTKWHVIASV